MEPVDTGRQGLRFAPDFWGTVTYSVEVKEDKEIDIGKPYGYKTHLDVAERQTWIIPPGGFGNERFQLLRGNWSAQYRKVESEHRNSGHWSSTEEDGGGEGPAELTLEVDFANGQFDIVEYTREAEKHVPRITRVSKHTAATDRGLIVLEHTDHLGFIWQHIHKPTTDTKLTFDKDRPNVLKGSLKWGKGTILSWDLTREAPSELRANPGGPYTVVRGEPLTLDGSASEGDIDAYVWTFSPADADGPPDGSAVAAKGDAGHPGGSVNSPADAGALLEGKQVSVILLEDITVTLTVKGKGDTSGAQTKGKGDTQSASTKATARQRKFETKYDPSGDTEGVLPLPGPGGPFTIRGFDILPVNGALVATNRCAGEPLVTLSDFLKADHILHVSSDQDDIDWENRAYTLEQVDNKQANNQRGPFHGHWHVKKPLFTIQRKIYVNPYFMAGGPRPPGAAQNWYEANMAKYRETAAVEATDPKAKGDFNPEKYVQAAIQHEHTHSRLIVEWLAKKDKNPGLLIEAMHDTKKKKLNEGVYETLKGADAEIYKFMTEALDAHPSNFPTLWEGEILIWDVGRMTWDRVQDRTSG